MKEIVNNPSKVFAPSVAERAGVGSVSVIATIGFFDGVHRGHQYLIQQVQKEALRRGGRSLLITFDRHPRSVFAPDHAPHLLTTADEKQRLLHATGVDDIYVLPFDHAMAALSACEFMGSVLRRQLGVDVLVIGYDHHFGRPQGEGFEEYLAYGQELGIEVVLAQELEGEHVSSSAIRRALETGDVEVANRLLGRPYTWTGRVVHGHALGRQLGFPTANLEGLTPSKVLPACGAYAITTERSRGMVNIGRRPTIDNGDNITIEANLFDLNEDLYGQELTLSFIARLREEQRFDSEAQLAQQLQTDRERALHILTSRMQRSVKS